MKNQRSALSKFTDLCLVLFTDEHMRETIMEDIEDCYANNKERKGSFLSEMIWLCKLLFILMTFVLKACIGRTIMFKNYLKISLRNIKRHRSYSFINIMGLAIGIACCMLIILWVQNESNYDCFHENADNIYMVPLTIHSADGRATTVKNSAGPLGSEL